MSSSQKKEIYIRFILFVIVLILCFGFLLPIKSDKVSGAELLELCNDFFSKETIRREIAYRNMINLWGISDYLKLMGLDKKNAFYIQKFEEALLLKDLRRLKRKKINAIVIENSPTNNEPVLTKSIKINSLPINENNLFITLPIKGKLTGLLAAYTPELIFSKRIILEIFVELYHRGVRLKPLNLKAILTDKTGNKIGSLIFNKKTDNKNRKQNDLIYYANYNPKNKLASSIPQNYNIIITCKSIYNEKYKLEFGVQHHEPISYLTGQFKSKINNGNLQLQFGITPVKTISLLDLTGLLSGPNSIPILQFKSKAVIKPNQNEFIIEINGELLYNSWIDGPYSILNLKLKNDKKNISTINTSMITNSFKHTDFKTNSISDIK